MKIQTILTTLLASTLLLTACDSHKENAVEDVNAAQEKLEDAQEELQKAQEEGAHVDQELKSVGETLSDTVQTELDVVTGDTDAVEEADNLAVEPVEPVTDEDIVVVQ